MSLPKACMVCGVVSDQAKCPEHRRRRTRPSSTKRGYDGKYLRRRGALLAAVRAAGGFHCHWCGHWFEPGAMQADHEPPLVTRPVDYVLVPACRSCNASRTANLRRSSL